MRHFLTTLFTILTITCFSQEYGTIYFLGSGFLSGKIYINNQFIGNIETNETIEYRVHTEGIKNITLETGISRYGNVDVKKSGVYYFKIHSCRQTNAEEGKEMIERSTHKVVIEEEEPKKAFVPPKLIEVLPDRHESTCFLISKDGLLLTDYYSVKDSRSIKIQGIGGDFSASFTADIVAFDEELDIALLKVQAPGITFPEIPYYFSSEGSEAGSGTFMVGFIPSPALAGEIKVKEAMISSKNAIKGSISHYGLSAKNEDNNGSPLFNQKGEIIGIINGQGPENEALALKSPYINAFLKLAINQAPEKKQEKLSTLSMEEKIKKIRSYIFTVKAE